MIVAIDGIIGIDQNVASVLGKYGITTVKKFYDATRTEEARSKLAVQTGLPLENIEYWAVQAELLRIENMTPENAYDIVHAGILSVEDFQTADKDELFAKIKRANTNTLFTKDRIERLQKAKARKATSFQTKNLKLNNLIGKGYLTNGINDSIENKAGTGSVSMFNELSDIISELGEGIARAQMNLDLNSIKVQNEILQNEELSSYGLNATWYAMPEVAFDLKMEYSVVEEKQEEGKYTGVKRIKVMPVNATYNNYFRQESTAESTLKLRFVPIPPEEKFTSRLVVPSLLGKTKEEAIEILEEEGITAYKFIEMAANLETGKTSEIYEQSIEAGKFMLIGQILEIKVYIVNTSI